MRYFRAASAAEVPQGLKPNARQQWHAGLKACSSLRASREKKLFAAKVAKESAKNAKVEH
jgi:hypothetical protein